MVQRRRTCNAMVMDGTCVPDRNGHRDGLWTNLDICLIRGGKMRELLIITLILIIALYIWAQKGGRE